jgi:hypothetical protein
VAGVDGRANHWFRGVNSAGTGSSGSVMTGSGTGAVCVDGGVGAQGVQPVPQLGAVVPGTADAPHEQATKNDAVSASIPLPHTEASAAA